MAKRSEKRRKVLARMLTEHYRKWKRETCMPLLRMDDLQRRIEDTTGEEVSEKTLRRDFENFREVHDVKVVYDAGEGGWVLEHDPGDKLSDLRLKESDVLPLIVAREALAAVRGRRFEQTLRRLIDGICKDIGLELQREGDTFSLEECIKFKAVGAAEQASPHFDTVVNAVLGRTAIKVTYRSRERAKVPQERLLHPHLLHCYRDQWRLVAWEPAKERMSTYLLSGIQSAESTESTFERQKRFAAEDYFDGAFGVFTGKENHEIEVHFSAEGAERVRGRSWHRTQQIEELEDGTMILRARVNTLVEVASWILSFGPEAWAVRPPELVQRVRDALAKAEARYPGSKG